MKIVCIDLVQKIKNIKKIYDQPLGGTTANLVTICKGFIEHGHSVVILGETDNPSNDGWLFYDSIDKWKDYVKNADVLYINSCIRTDIVEYGHDNMFYTCRDLPSVVRTQWMSDKRLLNEFKGLTFVSEFQKHLHVSTYKLPPEKCHCVYNPIYTPLYNNSCTKREHNRFIYASAPCKGINALPEIINRLNNRLSSIKPEFYIYSSESLYNNPGDLPFTNRDPRYIEAFDTLRCMDNVYVRDVVGKADLAEKLKTSTILLHPHEYTECCPSTILEAMAAGCVPVMVNKGPSEEVIQNNITGKLVEPVDITYENRWTNFVDSVCELYNDYYIHLYRSTAIEWANDIFDYMKISRLYLKLFGV